MSQIHSTTDLSLFQTTANNRDIRSGQVARLIASITQADLLPDNPIIVSAADKDGKHDILDGQHRVEALIMINARRIAAGKPPKAIYYKISEVTQSGNVPLLNSARSAWGPNDYLKHYSAEGNAHYTQIISLCEKYKCNPSCLRRGLPGLFSGKIKDGTFKILDLKATEQYMASVRRVSEALGQENVHSRIFNAYANLYTHDNFNEEVLIKNIRRLGPSHDLVVSCNSVLKIAVVDALLKRIHNQWQREHHVIPIISK